jgi:hypothetical protein
MKKTVLCHFFNEEYLLPWWLKHHRQFFDHGVMINYGSWDRSVEIIRELCPTWEIHDSRNEYFAYPRAEFIDDEMMCHEINHAGWKTILNVTEFLVGDYRLLDNVDYSLQVKQVLFVDEDRDQLPTHDKPLWEQKINAIDFDMGQSDATNVFNRHARLIHFEPNYNYSPGRHFSYYNTDQLAIFYYAWSPWNVRMKMRRMQTGAKMHPSEQIDWQIPEIVSNEFQRFPHNMYPPFVLEQTYNDAKKLAKPQQELIDYYVGLMNTTEPIRTWRKDYDQDRHNRRGRFYKHTHDPDDKHENVRKDYKSDLLSSLFDDKPQPEATVDGNNISI